MEGKTSTKASNSSEDPSSTPRKRSGVEEGRVKRKVEEQTEKVAKVARCREGGQGTAGLTSEAELTDSDQDGSGKNSDDEESGEKVLNRSGVKKSVDEKGEMKQELKKVTQEKETIVAKLKKSEDEKDQVIKELNKAKQDIMNYRYLTGKSKNEKNHLEEELKYQELENDHLKHKVETVTQERDNSKHEKDDVKHKSEQRKVKLDKVTKVLEELQEKLECPVCLAVPREGPVPCCPSGHITCSPCLERLRMQARPGRVECPTCKVPMEEGRSLLARVVIESMQHQCSFEGCGEMVEHKEYNQHQEACRHREVICPSNYCDTMMAFCEVEEHARTCEDISFGFWKVPVSEEQAQDASEIKWNSAMFNDFDGATFFLQILKEDNIFSMDVVMLGSKEQCKGLKAKVSITNPVTKEEFHMSTFSPRPITDTNDTEDASLIIRHSTIAKGWHFNQETKQFEFEVKAKIYRR